MSYQGNYPPSTPLTSNQIATGAVQPANLSTGGPSWDASNNVTAASVKNSSSASANIVLNTDGSATFAQMPVPPTSYLRNRLINGAALVSQRGAVNVTAASGVTYKACDRFAMTNYWGSGQVNTTQATTAPAGFANSIGLTVATAAPMSGSTGYAANIWQSIEGLNIYDAYSSNVTLSFWVNSSITGTYSVTFSNVSINSATDGSRIYVANYTINVANTWEYKTITVNLANGTSGGTWVSNNNTGLCVIWNLGAESNRKSNGALNTWLTLAGSYPIQSSSQTNWISNSGATFYLAGTQLEVGNVSTPYERRLISQELAMCQRYFEAGTVPVQGFGQNSTGGLQGSSAPFFMTFRVSKRATPTASLAFNAPIDNASSTGFSVGQTTTEGMRGNLIIANTGFFYASAFMNYTASAEL